MEEHSAQPVFLAVFATALIGFVFIGSATCGSKRVVPTVDASVERVTDAGAIGVADASAAPGISAPIAATRVEGGDVVVVALDVAAKGVRAFRIGPDDTIKVERILIDDVAWVSDAELKIWRAGDGVAVVWRGKRGGKVGRFLAVAGPNLVAKREPTEVAAGSCATEDALYSTDGRRVVARKWTGGTHRYDLRDEDAELDCAAHRAFAIVDDEDKTNLVLLEADEKSDAGADAAARDGDGGASAGGSPSGKKNGERRLALFDHKAFGEDEQRERAVFTSGDDIGVVRVGTNGSVTVRELAGHELGAPRKLKRTLTSDDDVVAVDASPKYVVVVYTADASESCPVGQAATKVMAMRLARAGAAAGDAGASVAADAGDDDEPVYELAPGACGREVGPFFTGPVGDRVSVAWVERASVRSQEKAPITGIVFRPVGPNGIAPALGRIDQPADAISDALCDDTRCYAVALARKPGADVMVPGFPKILRYP